MRSFNGWTPVEGVRPWQEVFDKVYDDDDGEVGLLSKEVFHWDFPEDGLVFDYRYYVRICDLMAYDGEDARIRIALYMLPDAKDWCDKARTDVARSVGAEDLSPQEQIEAIWPQDAVADMKAPPFGHSYIEYDGSMTNGYGYGDVFENSDVVETLDTISAVLVCLDRTAGFQLDRSWNLMGTTGWDILGETINGQDAVQSTMRRLRPVGCGGGTNNE